MATLLKDAAGVPVPQYYNDGTAAYEQIKGQNGGANMNVIGAFDALTQAPVTGVVTVGSSATELYASGARLAGRHALVIYNSSGSTIYIGDSGVTTSTGFPVLAGDTLVLTIDPNSDFAVYAITASSAVVRVMELK